MNHKPQDLRDAVSRVGRARLLPQLLDADRRGAFKLKLSGCEVYYTNSLILPVKIMLCSKLHCQKGFKLKPFFYKIAVFETPGLHCRSSSGTNQGGCKGRFGPAPRAGEIHGRNGARRSATRHERGRDSAAAGAAAIRPTPCDSLSGVSHLARRCTALEATNGQNDSFFSQHPYKCYLEEVGSICGRLT